MAIKKIHGFVHADERGRLVFFNEFSMEPVKRFYEISIKNTQIVRAWQGHLLEYKWFYCCEGAFIMYLIPLDQDGKLRPDFGVERFELSSQKPIILEVPGGFASGFKALQENSKLTVFSNASLTESKTDDYRFVEHEYHADWRS